MTLSRNINFDENEGLDEMLAGLDLTPSRMKTHKIQSSEENEALEPVLQAPHLTIKSTLHAESPAFPPFPTLNPSWDEIKELLDDEAHNFRYDFADEISQHSLLQQQRKLVLANAKRIMDDQKRIEDARMMLQAPSVHDCDDFSSQFAEIERVELLIEETPKTQCKRDASVDLSFAERKKEEENEQVHETVSEIGWLKFENLAEGEATVWSTLFLCAGESCKLFDIRPLRNSKNARSSSGSDGE